MRFETRITDPKKYIEERTIPEPNSGCWIWTGTTFLGGYGYAKAKIFGPMPLNASRASWMAYRGDPKDRMVCHSCDNRACCNPDHLFLGSGKDNMQDCSAKGRIDRGEKRYNAKANDELVRTIRLERMRDQTSYDKLAVKHGLAKSLVAKIAVGTAWAHVVGP